MRFPDLCSIMKVNKTCNMLAKYYIRWRFRFDKVRMPINLIADAEEFQVCSYVLFKHTEQFYYRLCRCADIWEDTEELYLTIRKHGVNKNILKIKSIKFVNNHCRLGYCNLNDRSKQVTEATFMHRYIYRDFFDINVRSKFRVSLRTPV